MPIAQALLPEFDQEMAATRKLLERVPDGKFDWSPHEKSMTLGRLAGHLAELPMWTAVSLDQDEFDVNPPDGEEEWEAANLTSSAETLELFDKNSADAREKIASTGDATFFEDWTLKSGGETLFTIPKIGVVRSFILNHSIHHRGQLTVFLRLLDVPVPQTYGPTADEPDF
ncbi:MAG: DinB family protein [Gemmatimonadales bacterium]